MSTARPRLTVDLGALAANYRTLQALRPGAETAAAVKADAYGLGVEKVAPALYAAGCRTFFVAYTFEGVHLRQLLPAEDARICVFNGPEADEITAYTEHRLTPVLNTLAQLDLWLSAGAGPVILHFDTAMNRLGLTPAEASSLLADPGRYQALDVSCLMSHLASGSDAASPLNARQTALFTELAGKFQALFPKAGTSLSASAGLFLPLEQDEQLIRPGIALYGGGPQDKAEPALKTVATLTAPILQIRTIRAGDTVGYNGLFAADGERIIATLGIGYADGYSRQHGNRSEVLLAGRRCPVVGAISMDLVTVDITECDQLPETGSHAECFGPGLPIEEVAAMAGTISYELISTLGARVERQYTA